MTTITLKTGQVSPIYPVSPGTRITSDGNGSIEYTAGTLTDAKNNPDWTTWPLGSTAGYMDTVRQLCIRATATADMEVTLEEGRADKYPDDVYFDTQMVSTQTDPTTGAVSLVSNSLTMRLNPTLRNVGYESEQPVALIAPVTNYGKILANFSGSVWTTSSGTPTLTQDYTGWDGAGAKTGIVSRTGQASMLKVVPAADTTEQITLGTPATNILNKSLGGKIGLWVYVDALPGYSVGGTVAGTLYIVISTTSSTTNGLNITFNTNQVREGWNFLKFVMRDPLAYQTGSGVTEYHPYGISCGAYGTGADSDIVNNDLALIKISWSSMSGATLYFDSLWTGFESTAQVVLGCDGGVGFQEYALPVFDSYGWVGYTAYPFNVADTGTGNFTYQSDLSGWATSDLTAAYSRGWDVINHTITHPSLGAYTSEAKIAWQIQQTQAFMQTAGFIRGSEFYASPQSSSSRVSEAVIKSTGIKLQRHIRKSNVSLTQFGLDNPHYVGSLGIGSASNGGIAKTTGGVTTTVTGMQIASKINNIVDAIVAYGDAMFPFWHGITTTGDTGTGEDLTGDDLLLTKSAFELSMAHIRSLEESGSLNVARGFTGFWYGGSV